MKPQKIKTLRDYQPVSLRTFVDTIRHKRHQSGPTSGLIAVSPVVKAEINSGRYIANCPFCTGAEMVDMDDLRFYCLSCFNEAVGGQWLQVEIPAASFRAKLEFELLKRPEEHNRNWLPSETLARIRQENKEHGVVG